MKTEEITVRKYNEQSTIEQRLNRCGRGWASEFMLDVFDSKDTGRSVTRILGPIDAPQAERLTYIVHVLGDRDEVELIEVAFPNARDIAPEVELAAFAVIIKNSVRVVRVSKK